MDALPRVSIIVPMRNEMAWIDRCLGAILAQDYPSDRMELIVVDGMSDDASYEHLSDLAKRDPRLRVLRNPRRIVPSSLNLAVREARGEVIVRVDAHTEIAPDYVRVGAEILARTGADNVGGPMVKIGGGAVGDAIAGAMSSRFGIGSYFQFGTAEREADTVYMGMWPRRVFEKVGLFDEELVRNQDDELSYRIRKAGGRILVSPAMRSRYQNRQSWRKLGRQFYEYGLWKTRVLQKHPRQMSIRHYVPPAFDAAVLAGLASGPVLGSSGPMASITALGAYAGTMALVSMREARSGGRGRYWLALVLIHHAWALGFLTGMVRFAPRWLQPEPAAPQLLPAA
ncbi:MAG TPA: glycosyltransferase family 2 protein, partial [Candidatus Binatia bacterium]|nr:glycosyltransferase family 2 protein [Candidatus Binatia bacterium]